MPGGSAQLLRWLIEPGQAYAGGQTLGGVVFLVLAFLVSPFGIPAIADWLMDRLYSLKYSLQDFITG